MRILLQDLRYAVRGFRKTPAFALTVIGTIGLALGLNTTVFTVFDSYMLKPYSVRLRTRPNFSMRRSSER